MKKKAQKYQNKIAFKVTFNEKYNQMADRAPRDRLCPQCLEQIEWKIQYGKYKVSHDLSKCMNCEQKVIFKAYRKLCDKCSDEILACAKCFEPREANNDSSSGEDIDMDEALQGMRERSKRTILRNLDKKLIRWSKKQKCFIDVETEAQVQVQYKKGFVDEEDENLWKDDDENSEDESSASSDEEQPQQKKQPIQKQQKQQELKNPKKQTNPKAKKQISSDDDSEDISEDDERNYCRDVISDKSRESDYERRQQKNFRFYFSEDHQVDQHYQEEKQQEEIQ